MYSYKSKMFSVGDKVMRRNGFTNEIFKVSNPYPQSRDRIVIEDASGNTDRVTQSQLRKLSRAELSVCNAYRKLIEDVVEGR